MASNVILCLMLTVNLIAAGYAKGSSFVEVQCKAETVGLNDQQSLLDCVIHHTEDVQDPTIRVVTWSKVGVDEPILFFNRGAFDPSPGYAFAEPSWNNKNLNVSLLIHKTSVKDEGVYTCYVNTDCGSVNGYTSLEVTAKYNKPTIKPDHEGINLSTLTCEATGGYPEGQLRWFDKDNKEWIKNPEMDIKKTESGLFSLSSTMTLQKGSIFSQYTCRVFNAKGEKEDEATFEVKEQLAWEDAANRQSVLPCPTNASVVGEGPKQDPANKSIGTASKIVAPVVVIGSLIVGLLIVLLVRRRRSQRDPRADYRLEPELQEGDYHSEKPIYKDRLTSGEAV
uniref:CD276 antigen isoform X2 n=1 Tax=Semicossyphus pulcher TaxID=241346 RepID=UPI0037E94230